MLTGLDRSGWFQIEPGSFVSFASSLQVSVSPGRPVPPGRPFPFSPNRTRSAFDVRCAPNDSSSNVRLLPPLYLTPRCPGNWRSPPTGRTNSANNSSVPWLNAPRECRCFETSFEPGCCCGNRDSARAPAPCDEPGWGEARLQIPKAHQSWNGMTIRTWQADRTCVRDVTHHRPSCWRPVGMSRRLSGSVRAGAFEDTE